MIKKGSSLKWIKEVTKYLISSTALAATLLYSNVSKAQEPTQEPKQEQSELPKEEKPKPKKEEDLKLKHAKPEPKSYLIGNILGGASPNNENQGSHLFSELNTSFKEIVKFDLFDAYKSSSIIDGNGIRTIINNPYNTKADLFVDTGKSTFLTLGFRGSLEETIRRTSTENFTTISTASILTRTRTKTTNVVEHYGLVADLDLGGFWFSFRPYETNKPTITEHGVYQKVSDINPAASFEANFEFRDPTPRIRNQGFAARIGHNRWFNDKDDKEENDVSLVTDLVGLVDQETIDIEGSAKKEIQRIFVGTDVYLAHNLITPRIALLKGFFDETPAGQRHSHGPYGTKFFASAYLDVSGIDLAKKVRKSKDPSIDSVVEKTNIPLLIGGSFSLDRANSPVDRIEREDGRLVIGIGCASGSEALKNVARIEDDLILKDLGLRPEEGENLSTLHGQWERYIRPFPYLANQKGMGLLLNCRLYNQKINGNRGIGYEGDLNLLLKQVILHAGLSYDGLAKERIWTAGLTIPIRDWMTFGGQYSESRKDGKLEGTYSFGARVNLTNEMFKDKEKESK